jgi:uncharacterized membrane protein YbhN (UPF0104 family)
MLTYLAAAGTYWWLAVHALSYARTLLIQIAGMFVNRLLPAGIGNIGVNYAYLRKAKHSATEAASVVAANNTLGIISHGLLLAILLVLYHTDLPNLHLRLIHDSRLVVLVAVAGSAVWFILYHRFGKRFQSGLHNFAKQLLAYRHRPAHLASALICSMSLTLSNVLCLWFCILALHADLSFIAVFLVFSFGVALGTATPTPGGLGGVEAGLVAGLVAYHLDGATALAAVLLFRLITYWLPLLAGSLAFVFSQRRHYI